MKIIVVHNLYQLDGGERRVYAAEAALLRSHGNSVVSYETSNAAISGVFARVRAALGCVFSMSSFVRLRSLLKRETPDVVHVHNFFPLISPAVFYACRSMGVPVVFTLHNFRIICPTATLMWNGKVTERSLHGGPWWALWRRVYRGSFIGTLCLCLMIDVHRRIGTWRRCVTRFVALTEFSKGKFAEFGVPGEKIVVKPNFAEYEAPVVSAAMRSGLLFVGRLSEEKGCTVLLASLRAASRVDVGSIDIAGQGPLAEQFAGCAGVRVLGWLPREKVFAELRRHVALVVPSVWYEGMPLAVIEAFAAGTPVIASRIGALAEMVTDGVTGLLVRPGDSEELAYTMRWAGEHSDDMQRMGENARREYERRYTPEIAYRRLMEVYKDAMEECSGH